jgi:hypothetical protein
MQNLQIHNPHFITYADNLFTIDILGGIDLTQIERMYCTLRIKIKDKDFPPMRSTLDLYNDNQVDKLIRTLCDKCLYAPHSYTFHTQISDNALYYFDSRKIDGKALFIEDLEWTNEMLTPLATLQTDKNPRHQRQRRYVALNHL